MSVGCMAKGVAGVEKDVAVVQSIDRFGNRLGALVNDNCKSHCNACDATDLSGCC